MSAAVIGIIVFACICISPPLGADTCKKSEEQTLLDFARSLSDSGEYYSAITELLRYQRRYPRGRYLPDVSLLMGKVYFNGGNYERAVELFNRTHDTWKNKPAGEEAFYSLARARLLGGSPFFAYRTLQGYQYMYNNGRFAESAAAEMCFALALMNELEDARRQIARYRADFPDGAYYAKLRELEILINEREQRPRKKMWLSFLGSLFVPGFGHFYTERYALGGFTLATNAACIYLIYDGYRDRNKFQMLFFSLLEFSFYQHSLFSSINNVYEYNRGEDFYKTVRLGLSAKL